MDTSPQPSPLSNFLQGLDYKVGYALGFALALLNLQADARALEQAANRILPNELPDPATSALAYRRGAISKETFYNELLQGGFNEATANEILASTENLIDLSTLTSLLWRQLISQEVFNSKAGAAGYSEEDANLSVAANTPRLSPGAVVEAKRRKLDGQIGIADYYKELSDLGWSDERIATLQQLEYYLPSLADLYNFAAWDINDPKFVATLGLDQGMPADFIANAAKLGVTADVAGQLWKAHWQLPSMFIIRMLAQSGGLPDDTLRQMLGAMQMPPAFVDVIVKAFKKKPSETQIEQLLASGQINASDVAGLIGQLGYSTDDAASIASLVINKVANTNTSAKQQAAALRAKYHGLTVANIETAYEDGLITRDEAAAMLADLSVQPDIINLQLAIVDHKVATAAQKDEMNYIIAQVEAGILDAATAYNQLSQLGLTALQLEKASNTINKKTSVKAYSPSVADLQDWSKAGLIGQWQFITELRKKGIPDYYIVYIVNYLGAKSPANPQWPTQSLPLAQLSNT